MLFKVINWMMALPEPHQQRYWQALLKLEKEKKMEWISPLEQSFIDKGRQQGIEQGRKEGAVALLQRQLTQRYGPLPKSLQRKLAAASLKQLDAWSDALPHAPSLQHLFA